MFAPPSKKQAEIKMHLPFILATPVRVTATMDGIGRTGGVRCGRRRRRRRGGGAGRESGIRTTGRLDRGTDGAYLRPPPPSFQNTRGRTEAAVGGNPPPQKGTINVKAANLPVRRLWCAKKKHAKGLFAGLWLERHQRNLSNGKPYGPTAS